MRWPLFLLMLLVACQVNEQTAVLAPTTSPSATPAIGISLITRVRPTAPILQAPTSTPLPPPTPTPSPTPILYAIQAGDTLLDIALQRGVTVADIEALNPSVQPELLQIGQQIVLPPRERTAVFATNRATPIPLAITISQLQLYPMSTGAAWVVGEVVNAGEWAAEGVAITVSLLDEAGAVAESHDVWVAAAIVPPQGYAPFALLLPALPDKRQPSVAVAAGQTVVDLGSRYLDLAVEMDAADRLTGRLLNVGTATAQQIRLVVSLYDENGRLTSHRLLTFPDLVLAPNESHPFTLDSPAASYRFLAQGLTH